MKRELLRPLMELAIAVRKDPDNADLRNDYGGVQSMQGRPDDAMCQFDTTLRPTANHAQARQNLHSAHTALSNQLTDLYCYARTSREVSKL
ncbi:MAG: hypothetical protein ACE145_18775 [Terriglobia bacterium]